MHSVATVFQKLCYTNKDQLSAGIIVAGWDKEVGPSVYNIPVGGKNLNRHGIADELCLLMNV